MGDANEKFQLDKIIKLEKEVRNYRRALGDIIVNYNDICEKYELQKELADARLARVRELETELSEIFADDKCNNPDCLCKE